MRLSAHSLRLAVSFLLGVVFLALPVAKSASASSPTIQIRQDTSTLASTEEYCSYDQFMKAAKLYAALTMLRYKQSNVYLANSITITEGKTEKVTSLSSVKTVLKKAEEDDKTVVEVTPSETAIASPSPQTQGVSVQATASQVQGGELNAEVLFALVNAHRTSIGLPALQKDPRISEIVTSRAPEIQNEIYGSSYMHAGFFARNLPYFATENIIHHTTEQTALQWWLNSPVHRSAIEGSYQYADVACSGKNCAMVFTNFVPKQTAVQPQAITPTPLEDNQPK